VIFTAIILVPTQVEIHAESRAVASEEARDWARRQKAYGDHCAKVLSIQPIADRDPPPKKAA